MTGLPRKLEPIQRKRVAAFPTFNLQDAVETRQVGGRANVLRRHSPPMEHCANVAQARRHRPKQTDATLFCARAAIPRQWSYQIDEEKIMTDNLSNRGPADRSRINVHEPWELAYWTKELNVSADQLRSAVARVGVMASDVRRELGR